MGILEGLKVYEAREGLGSMGLESDVCVRTPRSSRRSVCAFNSHALSGAVNKPIGQLWLLGFAQVLVLH